MRKELGENLSHDHIKEFLWKTLKSGQVVPGYAIVLDALSKYGCSDLLLDMVTVCSATQILGSLHCCNSAKHVLNFLLTPSSRW